MLSQLYKIPVYFRMKSQKRRIRELILYEFNQGSTAAAGHRNICEAEGEGTVSVATCERWFKKFALGDNDLDDKPRPGQPMVINLDALREAIEAEPSTSTLVLSNDLQCSQRTVVRGLRRIGKVNKWGKQVPYELTPANIQKRNDMCRNLLANPLDDRFFKQIVTCDEKWVLFNNPDNKKQWLDPGQAGKPTPKPNFHQKKVMLCVWWNMYGIVHFEFIPQGQSINAKVYCAQLDRVQTALTRIYPTIVNRNQVLLLQDNAKPHTAKLTQHKISALGWEALPHPPYSPDIAPSDYHLFRSLEHFLRGKQFTEVEQVKTAVEEFFASKDQAFYKRGIELLAERWSKVIDANGEYFI